MCTDDVIDPRAMHVYVHVRYSTTNKVNKERKKKGKLQASSADIKVLDANSNRILKPTT